MGMLLSIPLACTPKPSPSAIPLYAQEQYIDGRVALHGADDATAETAARAAIAESPDFYDAHVLLAEALFRLNREAEALDSLDTAEQLNPARPTAWLLRGMARERGGDLPGAQEFYQRARGLYDTAKPEREQRLEFATASYLALGRLAGFQAIDPLLEANPEDQEAKVLRSQISQDQRVFFLDRVSPRQSPGKKE